MSEGNGFNNGNSMNLGGGQGYGTGGQARDGSSPPSAAWGLFAGDPVWRI